MIYFASDFHLGVPDYRRSREREDLIVKWLQKASQDATEIFLVGDIFDFWFEYKKAVPKGFVRLLGEIARITDLGITVNVFTGNHDMWMFGYLEQECGVKLFKAPIEREYSGKKFYIGHGDGLGPGDHGYKMLKKVFSAPLCRFLFRQLHPDVGIRLASYFSHTSRNANYEADMQFLGEEKEWLIIYCKEMLQSQHFDYFVFGHRHLPLDIQLNEASRYINLGDWISHRTYAVFDGKTLHLKKFEP